MGKLYLENQLVDLPKKSITLSKQINNIADLRDSQANYSNKFVIPFTPTNKRIMQGAGIVGSQSRAVYRKMQCNYLDDGVDIITDGYAIVDKLDSKGYHCTIYDGNISFFEKIKDKKLSDLDLSELDHQLTTPQYINSFSQDYADGYIYAVSDFGNFDPNEIVINYQLPSFFVAYLWGKIWGETGFNYYGDVFNLDEFKELIITPKRGYDSEIDAGGEVWSDVANCSTKTATDYKTPDPTDLLFDVSIILELSPDGSHLSNNRITITESANYHVELDLTGTHTINNYATSNFTIKLFRFEGIEKIEIATQTCSEGDSIWDGILDKVIYCEVGWQIFFEVNFTGWWEAENSETFSVDNGGDFTFETENSSLVNVVMKNFIGEVSQKDFIKDVMQHFGLMMQKRLYSDEYDFIKRDTLITNVSVIDWSDRFIKTINTSWKLNYAQRNIFAYQYRETDGEHFADGVIEIDNNTLPIKRVELTRPYNACEISDKLLNSTIVTFTPFWVAKRDNAGNITDWKVIKGKNYFGKVTKKDETITYKTASGNADTYTGIVPRLSFDELGYQFIITRHYPNTKKVLDWSNIKEIEVLLNKNEFKNFDFFKLRNIKRLGSNFIVNKIISYKGMIAKCEIVLIPYL